MPQKRFGGHQNQWLAEIAVHLAAQDMEVIRWGGAIGNDPIVLPAHLQEPLKFGRAVLGALAFIAVWQQHHQTRHAQPFAFAYGCLQCCGETRVTSGKQLSYFGVGAEDVLLLLLLCH